MVCGSINVLTVSPALWCHVQDYLNKTQEVEGEKLQSLQVALLIHSQRNHRTARSALGKYEAVCPIKLLGSVEWQ